MKNDIYNSDEFISIMNDKFKDNKPINLTVTGNSMVPFLVHKRDTVILTFPDRKIKKGDIVFYKRENGKCVLHRVKKVTESGIYFIGDAQTDIEGPLDKSCVLAVCKSAIRKGKYITEKSIIWKIFAIVWLNMIPLRLPIIKFISKIKKHK